MRRLKENKQADDQTDQQSTRSFNDKINIIQKIQKNLLQPLTKLLPARQVIKSIQRL